MRSPQNPSNRSANPQVLTNEEQKIHYESILEYLKYCVSIGAGTITIIVGVAIYFTYSSVKDLKDELRTNAETIQSNLQNKEKELQDRQNGIDSEFKERQNTFKEKEDEMKSEVSQYIALARDEISNSRDLADKQINNIKDIATQQAQNRVEEVFDRRNLEDFIEDVAEKRIQPKVNSIVDSKFKRIDSLKDQKIADEINSLTRNTGLSRLPTLDFIQENRDQLNESHYKMLVNAFYHTDELSQSKLINILYQSASPVVTQFFKNVIWDTTNWYYKTWGIDRFLTKPNEQSLQFYISYMKPRSESGNDGRYFDLVSKISKFDIERTLDLLNSKEAVELALIGNNLYMYQRTVEDFRNKIRNALQANISDNRLDGTYFFSFKPSWVEWYDMDFQRKSDWYHPKN